jgi:hypothetical protein
VQQHTTMRRGPAVRASLKQRQAGGRWCGALVLPPSQPGPGPPPRPPPPDAAVPMIPAPAAHLMLPPPPAPVLPPPAQPGGSGGSTCEHAGGARACGRLREAASAALGKHSMLAQHAAMLTHAGGSNASRLPGAAPAVLDPPPRPDRRLILPPRPLLRAALASEPLPWGSRCRSPLSAASDCPSFAKTPGLLPLARQCRHRRPRPPNLGPPFVNTKWQACQIRSGRRVRSAAQWEVLVAGQLREM